MVKKLKDIYQKTLDSNFKFEGNIENINYYNAFIKAGVENFLFNLKDNMSLCTYKYDNSGQDSVLFIFSIPINDDRNYRSKFLSEKVMGLLKDLEMAFVTLDIVNCDEVKQDKFIYLKVIKNEVE